MARLRSLSVVLAMALAAPASAGAATLDANRACYGNANLATLSGSGFTPDSLISFTVNGRELEQTATSGPAGDVLVRYDPARTRVQRKLVIRATDSQGESARTTIFVSPRRRVTATPDSSPNVRTWKAVLRLFGFGDGKAFIHYVNPNGIHKKTIRLGRLRGPCGKLKTEKRRVMPFNHPQFGVWRLQFDTRRRYDEDTERKRVIPVHVYRG